MTVRTEPYRHERNEQIPSESLRIVNRSPIPTRKTFVGDRGKLWRSHWWTGINTALTVVCVWPQALEFGHGEYPHSWLLTGVHPSSSVVPTLDKPGGSAFTAVAMTCLIRLRGLLLSLLTGGEDGLA